MKKPRLTPKQIANLIAVYEHWGTVAHMWHLPDWLRRDPTKAELDAYFADQAQKLTETHTKLVAAVEACDYQSAKGLADTARSLKENLEEDREEAVYGLYTLTDDAKAIAALAIAKRDKGKDVAVVDEQTMKVVERFETIAEAEQYIAELPNVAEVQAGRYGIDAPETKLNKGAR